MFMIGMGHKLKVVRGHLTDIDREHRTIVISNEVALEYDLLVIATNMEGIAIAVMMIMIIMMILFILVDLFTNHTYYPTTILFINQFIKHLIYLLFYQSIHLLCHRWRHQSNTIPPTNASISMRRLWYLLTW